jgi:hypothetical protein
MSILTHPAVTTQHPTWCSPLSCDATVPSDVRHASAPEVLYASELHRTASETRLVGAAPTGCRPASWR